MDTTNEIKIADKTHNHRSEIGYSKTKNLRRNLNRAQRRQSRLELLWAH